MNLNLTSSHVFNGVAGLIAFLYLFFGVYVLVMGLYRAHLNKSLTKPGYVMGAPWLALGYAMDVIANLTIFTVVCVELPRELLVTTRLKRYLNDERQIGNWRWRVAHQICTKLLDYFDPNGKHC